MHVLVLHDKLNSVVPLGCSLEIRDLRIVAETTGGSLEVKGGDSSALHLDGGRCTCTDSSLTVDETTVERS